jgi:hypothetical protein
MGERQNGPFQLSFNASLKVDFQGSRTASEGGLILVRELDERLRFGHLIAQHLADSRRGKKAAPAPSECHRSRPGGTGWRKRLQQRPLRVELSVVRMRKWKSWISQNSARRNNNDRIAPHNNTRTWIREVSPP